MIDLTLIDTNLTYILFLQIYPLLVGTKIFCRHCRIIYEESDKSDAGLAVRQKAPRIGTCVTVSL